ncbi:MAG TPA: TIGR03435 family protein [Bryobacteraceae bacterium]
MMMLLIAAGLGIARAQNFDVASVRIPPPHVIGQPYDIAVGVIQNDTITFTNASLADCIQFAYGLSSKLQLSGPDWITSAEFRYNIVAKAAPGATHDQILHMMQALLAERFGLAYHREQRPLSYYALVVAKSGAKMPGPTDAPAIMPAGVKGQLHILSNRMPMSDVVSVLSRYMKALVVDQTGLAGEFEVKLVWTPDDRPAPEDQQGASIFAAVQEQLGLKLESRKGPMEVMVVDHAEKTPTEN